MIIFYCDYISIYTPTLLKKTSTNHAVNLVIGRLHTPSRTKCRALCNAHHSVKLMVYTYLLAFRPIGNSESNALTSIRPANIIRVQRDRKLCDRSTYILLNMRTTSYIHFRKLETFKLEMIIMFHIK